MTKVIITVQDGMIQEVFSTDQNIDVEVLDFDTQDISELKRIDAEYEKIRKDETYKNIW